AERYAVSFTEIERVWQLQGLDHQKKLDTSPLTIEELDALYKQLIDEIQADIIAFEERSAIQAEICADGKMTTDHECLSELGAAQAARDVPSMSNTNESLDDAAEVL